MYVSDTACLLRRSETSEKTRLLVFFGQESGLMNVLGFSSQSAKDAPGLPGLFDTGSLTIQRKGPGKPAYLREFTPVTSYDGIGRRYQSLQAAASLSRFFERNLIHMEVFSEAWTVLHKALGRLSGDGVPEVVLLKAWFTLARSEGYPVTAHWLNRKPLKDREKIIHLLKSPANLADPDSSEAGPFLRDLESFFKAETDLLPPHS